jgi:hypothetical protein
MGEYLSVGEGKMEKIISLECPKCHCSIKPQSEWFQCGYCGAFLKLVEDDNGQQFLDMGVISGDRMHRVSHDLVHVIENESELIRSTMQKQHIETSDAQLRLANVNYLLYLARKKEGIEKEIAELVKKPDDLESGKQLEKFKKELADVLISIEDYECQIDPGRAGRKAREAKQKEHEAAMKAQQENDKRQIIKIFLIAAATIAVIILITAIATSK